MYRMSGAQIIKELLKRQGVRTVFGIPGGSNLPIYDALATSRSIRHVLTRHEQGAGFMAQGMARVTGEPGVCMTTSGPGATNVLTALADAKLDSVPVVCITGQVPGPMIGTDAFQEVDTYGMSIPLTKHNFLVRTARELLEVIPAAFRIAASGRPGPVLVDVPKDVQTEIIEFADWPDPGVADMRPAPESYLVQKAAELINSASRPVLYLGGGVIGAGAADSARALAEKISAPAAMTLMGLGSIPHGHPLYMGMLGMHAAKYTNLVMEECDLILVAGARFDDRATGKLEKFCPNAKIVHIDIDPSELGKLRRPDVGLTGDVRLFFEALLPLVHDNGRAEWLARIKELSSQCPACFPGEHDARTPYGIVTRTAAMLDEDTVIATDVGQHQMRTAQAYPFRRPGRWLTSGGLGTMGFGLPAAIGAAMAEEGKRVVCFSGDGSLMMNIQELATAAEIGANVKIVLVNNNCLGLVRQQQAMFYENTGFASKYSHAPDFVRIAEGFGIRTWDLATAEDPEAAIAEAMAHNGPSLIHAPVSEEEHVYPMVPPGASNAEMIEGEIVEIEAAEGEANHARV